jgi:hypothetical protein
MRWADITIVEQSHPQPRQLTDLATAMLGDTRAHLCERLDDWHTYLADAGVEPGDAHTYTAAAALAIDRGAAALQAAAPDWLDDLLGGRPSDNPAATQVWDDTVREIAAHRLRAGITDPSEPTNLDPGIDGDPALMSVANTVIEARAWLLGNLGSPEPPTLRTRSTHELNERRSELDAVLATAPPDVRQQIDRSRSQVPLPRDSIESLLNDLTTVQKERQQWILEHWPEVVEAAEVTNRPQQEPVALSSTLGL